MQRRIQAVVFVWSLIAALLTVSAAPQGAQTPAPKNAQPYILKATTNIVVVNVSVRDKQGNFVQDLKQSDFTVLEDGKPQQVISMDIEKADDYAAVHEDTAQVPDLMKDLGAAAPAKPKGTAQPAAQPKEEDPVSAETFKDRRVVVLFFDLSSMQPEEIQRSIDSAKDYVNKQMQPADLVGIVTYSTALTPVQDFTSDKEKLLEAIDSFNPQSGQGNQLGTDGDTTSGDDTGAAYVADDTEYNIFNNDQRLLAIQQIAETLAPVQQKKSMLYFSSGLTKSGVDNQSQIRKATAAAQKANLSIYTVDVRGLQAIAPGGDASHASQRGSSSYSGAAMASAFNSNFTSQETLVTLAGDTGGKAFLDSNDFRPAFTKMQEDTSMYYLLSYTSTNMAKDGRFRRITVNVKRPNTKVTARSGYYAESDFMHSTKDDREQQLQEQLAADLPTEDIPVYLSTGYFRVGDIRYFVPVSLVIPGSAIPLTKSGQEDKATIDVAGYIRGQNRQAYANPIRDTVKLQATDVKHKNFQYDTFAFLPPGQYKMKFVLRENQTGQMGSFEADVNIPDLKAAPMKVSSVIASGQKQPTKTKRADDPLIRNGTELVPSVTHVFSTAQHMYLYYELYDPAKDAGGDQKSAIHVISNATFYRGSTEVLETPVQVLTQENASDRKAATFELDVPLSQLKPGYYTCQVNVIDDAAGRFIFPRLAVLVR